MPGDLGNSICGSSREFGGLAFNDRFPLGLRSISTEFLIGAGRLVAVARRDLDSNDESLISAYFVISSFNR